MEDGRCSALQCSAVNCSSVHCTALHCSAVQFSSVQYSAVHCSTAYRARCSAGADAHFILREYRKTFLPKVTISGQYFALLNTNFRLCLLVFFIRIQFIVWFLLLLICCYVQFVPGLIEKSERKKVSDYIKRKELYFHAFNPPPPPPPPLGKLLAASLTIVIHKEL